MGFLNAGYEVLAAFDNWDPAVRAYRSNFAHPVFKKDLSKFNEDDAAQFAAYQADMIIGGPPCQDFSSAGKRDETLGRADLTVTFARIVTAVRPAWFVMENVDRAAKSRAYQKACDIFLENGYGLTKTLLDASFCGVPQRRKRWFLIGQLRGRQGAVEPYLKKNLAAKPMTLRDYFGDRLGCEHYYRHPRSYRRRGVFSVDEPSPTVRGVNRPIPPNYKPHPGDTTTLQETPCLRPLTALERSLIQTFPENFRWDGTSKAEMEQLVGNAVPVKLGEFVARRLREYVEDSRKP